jgi:sugar lactone lactonase YvrE
MLSSSPVRICSTLWVIATAVPAACFGQSYTISTIAGLGNPQVRASRDGESALFSILNAPAGLALDQAGNLYVAVEGNNMIKKISPSGIISTVAGRPGGGFIDLGSGSFSGDGGPGAKATLNGPNGLALDATGALYVSDSENHRIRKIDSNGIIRTIAGTGAYGAAGDGGPAINAQLNTPSGVAVDSAGDIYISDLNNRRVRRISANGIIRTFLTGVIPRGLATDSSGNLYVADDGERIVKVTPAGVATTVAGVAGQFSMMHQRGGVGDGGPATRATLQRPFGVAVDEVGNVYFTEFGGTGSAGLRLTASLPLLPVMTFKGLTGTESRLWKAISVHRGESSSLPEAKSTLPIQPILVGDSVC